MTLEVRGLGKLLGGRWVLRDVAFGWDAGLLVVVGGNGAGKSTLLRTIAGVLEPDLGDVTIGGVALAGDRAAALAGLAYVPEAPSLPDALTVRELVSLIASLRRASPPSDDAADRLGVSGLFGERFGALSLGQRRRVMLFAALAGEPSVLLLDEPTNGLDAAGARTLLAWLGDAARAGVALLVATHDPALIERADGSLELAHGLRVRGP